MFIPKTFPIYFPTTTDHNSDKSNDVSNSIKPFDGVPVVLILGWSGSEVRHMKRVAEELYQKQISITLTDQGMITFVIRNYTKILAKNLLDFLIDQNLERHPIFIHSFSNGGGIIYAELCQFFKRSEYSHLNHIGTVIDSAPSNCISILGIISIHKLISKDNFLMMLIKLLVLLLLYAVKQFWQILLQIFFPKYYVEYKYPQILIEDQTTCSQLYLYSKQDKLVSYKFIQEHIEKRREKRNANIEEFCWEDSDHIVHFFYKYKPFYTKLVLDFLEKCSIKNKIN